jgi:hypothetical protein
MEVCLWNGVLMEVMFVACIVPGMDTRAEGPLSKGD